MQCKFFVVCAVVLATSCAITPAFAQTPQPGLKDAPLPLASKQLRPSRNTGLQFFSPTLAKKIISFDNVSSYQHSSGLFNVDMPGDWKQNDISAKDDVHVGFIDPTQSAIFLVRVVQTDETYDFDGLSGFLNNYLKGQFGKESKFSTKDPQDLENSTIGERFTFEATIGGKKRGMVGDAFALQAGPLASTILFLSDVAVYDSVKEDAYKVLTSYRLNTEGVGKTQQVSDEFAIGELTTFEHASGAFKIDVPSNWEKVENDKEGALLTGWVEPGGRGEVVVELVKVDKTFTRNQIRDLVVSYAKEVYGDKPGYTAGKPKVHSNSVSSVIFGLDRETDAETVRLVGLLYAWQTGKNVAFLRVLVPESRIEEVSGTVDTIVNSFSVDTTVNYLK